MPARDALDPDEIARLEVLEPGCVEGLDDAHEQNEHKSARLVNHHVAGYIADMIEPALSPEDTEALIAYARQKFAEERFPLSPTLRPIREALEKLDPKPVPEPIAPKKPYVPSSLARRKQRRR